MAKLKWTKREVIAKFQEAYESIGVSTLPVAPRPAADITQLLAKNNPFKQAPEIK